MEDCTAALEYDQCPTTLKAKVGNILWGLEVGLGVICEVEGLECRPLAPHYCCSFRA